VSSLAYELKGAFEAEPEVSSLAYELKGAFEAEPEVSSSAYELKGAFEAEPEVSSLAYELKGAFEAEPEVSSLAYELKGAFEAEPEGPSLAYDPWKISKSGTQSSAYDPWWSVASEPEKQLPVEPDPQVQLEAFESDKTFGSKPQPEVISSSSEKVEQDLVATLEELEQQLRAKGFVAMEPNSLSAIAQAGEVKSVKTVTPLSIEQMPYPIQETAQEQALPSALAEIGMLFHESAGEVKPAVSSALSSIDATKFPAEPLWLQSLRSSAMTELEASNAGPTFSEPIVSRSIPPAKVSQELPNTPSVLAADTSGLKFEPTSISASSSVVSEQAGVLNGQDGGANPFLESELETTMKRPAVRLQSMVHSIAPHDNASGIIGKVGTRERAESPVSKTVESETNYNDLLLKGYQHQLVGDYDEAMQNYRLVIRGAPELLGDVISNLRALLKLAPKYSIGYRVLGDAYMRQGEYLQAMDAYNSALTMAKKARS
jgi:hypothetical protein